MLELPEQDISFILHIQSLGGYMDKTLITLLLGLSMKSQMSILNLSDQNNPINQLFLGHHRLIIQILEHLLILVRLLDIKFLERGLC